MKKIKYIIYKATNIVNRKCYIGQTVNNFNIRKNRHLSDANKKSNFLFSRAIRKYGVENFKWEVLCECDSKEMLDWFEFCYICLNKSHYIHGGNGYNMTFGGEGVNGYKHTNDEILKIKKKRKSQIYTDKIKKKISDTLRGRCLSDETKLKISLSNKGKKRTEETKNKMRLSFKGIKKTDSHREKLRQASINWHKMHRNPMFNKHHSNETKKILSNIKRIYDDDLIIKAKTMKSNGMSCYKISKILGVSQGATERWYKNNFYNL